LVDRGLLKVISYKLGKFKTDSKLLNLLFLFGLGASSGIRWGDVDQAWSLMDSTWGHSSLSMWSLMDSAWGDVDRAWSSD